MKENGEPFSTSAAEISERYIFMRQLDKKDALYAEPCVEGFHVMKIRKNEEVTGIDIELLFNAVITEGLS